MPQKTFDYVIVGAGSAGCVLANRLSATGDSVLLIEAGGEDKAGEIQIPAAFSKLFGGENDWNLWTEPQDKLDGRRLFQPRGKVLGGSSSINAMIYIRGNRLDYDTWAELGCEGWGWDEVLPYFKKSEGNERLDGPLHGTDGPLTVTDLPGRYPLSDAFVEAGLEQGFEFNDDFNGASQEGFGYYQVTQRSGRRCSAAKAFLHPVRSRSNLEVWTKATVRRVLIDESRATGVELKRGGNVVTVGAAKEVILCAGAFGSPHILMHSGVGPGEHIAEFGIDVLVDRDEVGANLQDHAFAPATRRSMDDNTLDMAEAFPRVLKHLFEYLVLKKGPLVSNVGEAGAFVKSDPDQPAPDVQFHFAPGFFLEHGKRNPPKKCGFSGGGVILTPESRGTVRLAGRDPLVMPQINPRYYSDRDGVDMRRAIWTFRLTQELLDADAFVPFNGGPYEPSRVLETNEEIEDFVRESAETLYHPVGTCRMGSDDGAVVDAKLRVRGVMGLRVVDASVMPRITRGNTNAPTMMIAERAADFITGSK